MDNKLLKAACAYVGVELDRVMTYAIYEDRIAMVVNNGVKGCPKYVVPLVELVIEPIEEPIANAEPVANATRGATKLAKEKGLDLANVTGTGKNGRISVKDVGLALEILGFIKGEGSLWVDVGMPGE